MQKKIEIHNNNNIEDTINKKNIEKIDMKIF